MARFRSSDLLPFILFPTLVSLHLLISPYTKVEESFNLQATHDILVYGIPLQNTADKLRVEYDHFEFPGAVPRTFVGPLILSGLARPILSLGMVQGLGAQIVVRGLLGLFNAVALIYYARGVSKAFGRTAGVWYTLFQGSQFHVMYYASRTLPNMFAFGLTTFALRQFLPIPSSVTNPAVAAKRYRLAFYLLTIAGVIFRSEVALLLFTHIIPLLFRGNLRFTVFGVLVPAAVGGLFIGLVTTITVDSFFWQRFPLWPEFSAFVYNILDSKAKLWGTSPWHFYFTNSLPRLLMNPMALQILPPLAVGIPAVRARILAIALPALHYILMYSIEAHKEWRFIIYVVPPLTLTLFALPAQWLSDRFSKSFFYRIVLILVSGSLVASYVAQAGMLFISSLNYPGAVALNRVHELATIYTPQKSIVGVHMDARTCSSGVSHFLEISAPKTFVGHEDATLWIYDKTEDAEAKKNARFWSRFDYAITEDPSQLMGSWGILEDVYGFSGIKIVKPGEKLSRSGKSGSALAVYERLTDWARAKITRGWWIGVRMQPMLKIMMRGGGVGEFGRPREM